MKITEKVSSYDIATHIDILSEQNPIQNAKNSQFEKLKLAVKQCHQICQMRHFE